MIMRYGKYGLFATLAFVVCGCDCSRGPVVEVSPEGAVCSPAKAIETVREMRKAGVLKPGEKVTVKVAPGLYNIVNGLEVTGDVAPIAFVGSDKGEAIISGGRKFGPFAAGADGIWTCDVPSGFAFEQLWVNGTRATRAKSPNKFYHYVLATAGEEKNPLTGKTEGLGRKFFKADPKAVELLAKTPKDEVRDVIIHVWWSWDSEHRRLAYVDRERSMVLLASSVARDFFQWPKYCPRFTIENCRAALDAPGEWFLDRKANKVLYVPRPGERPETTYAIAPASERILRVHDAEDVSFRNLTFANNGFKMPANGIYEYQSAYWSEAAIEIRDARRVRLVDCHITQTANYGIWFNEGSSDCELRHTLIDDIGAGGIRLGGRNWSEKTPPEKIVQRIRIDDNIVTDGGHVFPAGTGIFGTFLKDCTITHNEICDMYYSGVCLGWTWGYGPAPNRNNEVSWNHIHHLGKGVLSDMGFVYTLSDSRGTVVKGNHGHDIFSYGYTGSGGTGLYPDEGSTGILWTSNLIHHTKTAALSQHFGKDNRFVNNIFAFSTKPGSSVVGRYRIENHTSLVASNNVFVWSAGRRAFGGPGRKASSVKDLVFGSNLWWSPDPVGKDAFNYGTFEDWRKSGMDEGSVFADPLFRDWEHGDWRLKPGSPAFKIGFKEWDYGFAGVRKENAAWRTKADSLAHSAYDVAPEPPKNEGRKSFRTEFETHKPGTFPTGVFNGLTGKNYGQVVETTKEFRHGKQSLEMRDAKGLQYVWMPHIYQSIRISSDCFQLGFSVKSDRKANFRCEWRESSTKAKNGFYWYGPSLSIVGDKMRVNACRRDAAGNPQPCTLTVPGYMPDTWFDVLFTVNYDQNGVPTWDFSATSADGTVKQELKGLMFIDPQCRRPDWVGIISDADGETVSYLDDYFYENK